MSWHFSRALVEEYSAATSSDGARSALSSGSPTPRLYLPSDRTTAFSTPSLSGMTFGLLTDDLGEELLTWFRAGFPARTFPSPAGVTGSTALDQDSGKKWSASLARLDPDSFSWKTPQLSLLEAGKELLRSWPRWAMWDETECWPLPTPERPTRDKESGLWPTPVADGDRRTNYAQGGTSLGFAVRNWPTPTVKGNYNRKGLSAKSGDGLATAVKKYPTPTARDSSPERFESGLKRNSPKLTTVVEAMRRGVPHGGMRTPPSYPTPTGMTASGGSALCKWGGAGARKRLNELLPSEEVNGALNPEWVEWLMGWPLGWTDLKPLATVRFQTWLSSRGRPWHDPVPHLSPTASDAGVAGPRAGSGLPPAPCSGEST